MPPIIEVKHLSKQFREAKAVSDLSFTVNEGDVYGFLGQNGAGKSTTIRMLLTLIRPDSGFISILGKGVPAYRREVLRQTGAVIEKPDLYKYLTAYENLSLFARLSGIRPAKDLLMRQLEMVGLAERAHSRVKTFSQGMKQRLGIATALVHDPKLIVLDEPTNGLDPQGIADMRQLIRRMSGEMGKTVVVSSHLLSEIEQVATRMLIIHKGKKVVEGSVKELLDPAKTVVQVETTNDALYKTMLQQSSWASCLQPDAGIVLEMHKEDIPAFTKAMLEMNIPFHAIRPMHSLENYFLKLTGN